MDFHIVIIWISPLSVLGTSGVFFNSFFDENHVSKQNGPRWDAAFCGITSEAILFAYVPKKNNARLRWVKLLHVFCFILYWYHVFVLNMLLF